MDSPGEILRLCRLCLVKDQVNIPIFEADGDSREIFLKISSCLPVKVSREDRLPKKICDGCSEKLNSFYEFWSSSANAEKTLLSWVGEEDVEEKKEPAVSKSLAASATLVKEESEPVDEVHAESIEESTKDEAEAPPAKRARRSAAVKAQINLAPDSEDDDLDMGEPLTKTEEESAESDGEDKDPSYTDMPGTSADDEQAGPSGMGKDGVEAPIIDNSAYEPKIEVKTEADDDGLPIYPKLILRKSKTIKNRKRLSKSKTAGGKVKLRRNHPPPVELDDPIECEICNQTYKNNVAFALHTIRHSEDGKYSCHLCNYKNTSKYHVEMHVRAHEGTTKYKCEVCAKAFTVSTHAVEHKYFHTGEKPFQCEICGKHFMFSRFLAAHRRSQHYEILTGSPLVKFDCQVCNKHYASASGLRRHKLSKHNDEGVDLSVLCDICGKRLSSREKLKFHRRIHTGYKPFACQVCSKAFTKKDQLIEHVRVHTGEKPHVCKFCGRGFTQRTPLKIHQRTHSGERPYVCACCGKGFVTKTSVDSHMRSCGGNVVSAFASTWMGHPLPQLSQLTQSFNHIGQIGQPNKYYSL